MRIIIGWCCGQCPIIHASTQLQYGQDGQCDLQTNDTLNKCTAENATAAASNKITRAEIDDRGEAVDNSVSQI